MSITKYKTLHGELRVLGEVQHECLLCGESLLWDSDTLAKHFKKSHRALTYREYSSMMAVMRAAGVRTGGRKWRLMYLSYEK